MTRPGPDDQDADFETILAAVMETARGRWFLSEYGRRNRVADTRSVLEAIARLDASLSGRRLADDMERLRGDLSEMTASIRRTRAELAALTPAGAPAGAALEEAWDVLSAIVRTTEKATADILDATEKVQETAWTMREGGFDPGLCDALDQRATEIYAACEFQDLTAQRLEKVLRNLGFLEERIAAMTRLWGEVGSGDAATPERPPDLTQADIDFVIVGGGTGEEPGPGPGAAAEASRPASVAAIQALGTREKLSLFT